MTLVYVAAGIAAAALVIYFLMIRAPLRPDCAGEPAFELNFSGGRLRILQLTDLHMLFPPLDGKTLRLAQRLEQKYRPDLIVVTGDLALSPLNFLCWRAFFKRIKNTPVAVCFGNHDGHVGFREERLARLMLRYKNALYASAPVSGAGNFRVCVKGGPALYFLDSGSYGYLCRHARRTRDRITADRTRWLRDTLRPGERFIAFCHIPPPQMRDAVPIAGERGCEPYCPAQDEGFMDAAAELGCMGVFFGHDHKNDFLAEYRGVKMAYGRIGGYIALHTRGMRRGARIIDICEESLKIDTYIVYDDEI